MNDEICELCKEDEPRHSRQGYCPKVEQVKTFLGWHPTNRFTPRKEGQAAQNPKCPKCANELLPVEYPSNAMLNREQWESVRAGDWFCSRCKSDDKRRPLYFWKKDFEAKAQPTCPPGCLPFDLDKALKGAELVTRGGKPATEFRKCNYSDCYTAYIEGIMHHYASDGREFGMPERKCYSDLFLAGEEGKEVEKPHQCSCGGEPVVEGRFELVNGYLICKACKRATGNYASFRDALIAWNTYEWNRPISPPPPETETQRQAQSEIDRQIEVMRRSRENGAVVERSRKGEGDFYSICNPDWNWRDYDYRIKPAETKPRPRVVRLVLRSGIWFEAHPEDHDFGLSVEFVEARPEVLSALKAAGIEAGKGEV